MIKLVFDEPDIAIGEATFDGNCVLGRQDEAKRLSTLVSSVETPMVIAVDGPWGSGKSHFLKLWCGEHHKVNGGTKNVVYFDAFEHDYIGDPLTALLGAIGDTLKGEEKATRKLWKVAGKLVPVAARIATSVATAGVSEMLSAAISDETLSKMSEEAVGSVSDETGALMQQAEMNRRKALIKFRETLGEIGQKEQLIIVVDELDRCRPDFALGLLEIAKHLFSVTKVHFILGVNLRELENTVKARYGAGVDAERYLRKFVKVRHALASGQARSKVDALNFFDSVVLEMFEDGQEGFEETIGHLRARLEKVPSESLPGLRDIQSVLRRMVLCGARSVHPVGFAMLVADLLWLEAVDPTLFRQAATIDKLAERTRDVLGQRTLKDNEGREFSPWSVAVKNEMGNSRRVHISLGGSHLDTSPFEGTNPVLHALETYFNRIQPT